MDPKVKYRLLGMSVLLLFFLLLLVFLLQQSESNLISNPSSLTTKEMHTQFNMAEVKDKEALPAQISVSTAATASLPGIDTKATVNVPSQEKTAQPDKGNSTLQPGSEPLKSTVKKQPISGAKGNKGLEETFDLSQPKEAKGEKLVSQTMLNTPEHALASSAVDANKTNDAASIHSEKQPVGFSKPDAVLQKEDAARAHKIEIELKQPGRLENPPSATADFPTPDAARKMPKHHRAHHAEHKVQPSVPRNTTPHLAYHAIEGMRTKAGIIFKVAVFRSPEKADPLIQKLRAQRYPVYAELKGKSQGKIVYTVYVGPFNNVRYAVLQRSRLEKIARSYSTTRKGRKKDEHRA